MLGLNEEETYSLAKFMVESKDNKNKVYEPEPRHSYTQRSGYNINYGNYSDNDS